MKNYFENLFKKDENFRGWKYYFDKHPVMVLVYSLLTIAFALVISFTALNLFMVILVSLKIIVQPTDNSISLYYLMKFLFNSTFNFLKPIIYTDALSNPSLFINVLDFMLRTALQIIFIVYFRQILFSAISNNPFEKKNITRLRIVALVALFSPFLIFLTEAVYQLSGYSPNLVSFPRYWKVRISYPFFTILGFMINPQFLFGAFIFVVAEVFKLGINLKDENDLTV